ncbi:MAG: phosphonoacetaldehyde reductase [Lachnospira sp.]|nr:phosphonoacetaldehyde reductase [Lachnospira sp.]
MSKQVVVRSTKNYEQLDNYIRDNGVKSIFLVCGASIKYLDIKKYIDGLVQRGINIVCFSEFESNPLYDSVVKGVKLFKESGCDVIMAVGGGSAMDVAKCIKLYSNMDDDKNYLTQEIVPNDVKLIAVPTTAGTGSEATRYAVIYYNGEKQSVSHTSCIPDFVLLDGSTVVSLPMYHKKASMMDAMCHAIEAFWSVNSTDESKEYSRKALKLIIKNRDAYLAGEYEGCVNMLEAAFYAGKAINITQTTAGHAMCYKLTSMYGLAHGHAAALCVRELFGYMADNTALCTDARGREYLDETFVQLADALGKESVEEAVAYYKEFVDSLELDIPVPNEGDFYILKSSVNTDRLKNNPVGLTTESIDKLYHKILIRNGE